MITDFENNKVYLAKGLSSPCYGEVYTNLVKELQRYHVAYSELPQTESPLHIWVRDFMPIQTGKHSFVQFRYDPDYLKDEPEYKPDVEAILAGLNIQVTQSDIVLDGGNVISCGEKAIVTDKIFKENPHYGRTDLIDTLSDLLEAELVIVPWDKYEEFGHADGMVRYLGGNKVLLNNYGDFDSSLRRKLIAALSPHFEITELHYGPHSDLSWAYLNFLHVGKFVFVPLLHETLAQTAFKQIEEALPGCIYIPIHHGEYLAKHGGALNCATWTTSEDVSIKSFTTKNV